LSKEEIFATKEKLELDPNIFFQLPDDVLREFRKGYDFARSEVSAWKTALKTRQKDKSFLKMWDMAFNNSYSFCNFPVYNPDQKVATRKAWGPFIEKYAQDYPSIVGGSADLEPSNVTEGFAQLVGDYSPSNRSGRNFAYGVREFPMGTINNGIAQHGGLKVFGATFFVFSDYERPAIRLRALQGLPVVSEYTHDSIFVGEDGPTHQPIEHLMACRSIPNLLVLRPGDANEALIASQIAFEQLDRPSMILLTRQGLPVFDRTKYPAADEIRKGGYVICDSGKKPEIIIIASGSEVWVALEVAKKISQYIVKVVNMACWELFDEQSKEYRDSVLGNESALRVSIEAGITLGWEHYTGLNGLNIGIDSFGESAPGGEIAEHFGITPDRCVELILSKLS
jgi:transketolase